MDKKIERVAIAICRSMGYDPFGCDEELLPANESASGWLNWFAFKPEAIAVIKDLEEQ